MLIEESNELNKSEIISSNNIFNEKKKYFNTTIKNKIGDKYSDSKNQNILINSLKSFSVKYELEEQKLLKSQKFVITFDELISLIRFCLEAQVKLYKYLKSDSENVKNLSQEFINSLSYYIYSYEKVEKINPNDKNNKKIKSPSEKENININANNGRSKKLIDIINKSTSHLDGRKKTKNPKNTKKESEEHLEKIKDKNKNSNKCMQVSRSYYQRNVGPKLFSPENNNIKEKNKKNENNNKSMLNKSVEKRPNTIFSDLSLNNKENKENSTKRKLNKSTEKRKSVKVLKNKNENKSLSIYTACENLKSSSFIFKHKNHEFSCTEQYPKKDDIKMANNIDSNNNNNLDNKKENKKIIFYNQNMKLGVKKQVITSNVYKPSNLANKLLQNGRKYITEFNGIKEEERKKQYYS